MMRIFLLTLAVVVQGDVYFQNPSGSNNRLNGEGREVGNRHRIFDSQNNDRGGYNQGNLVYYSGSILNIEWTNQHSCGDKNNNCELVLQYMCADHIRDGATETTIPVDQAQCVGSDCNRDKRYGMHETFDHHTKCRLRERNKGLFTADQDVKGATAGYTRQNPNGERFGCECQEERDYYPYWHPSPWRDIAVLTNNVTRCEFYQAESENAKGRSGCEVPEKLIQENLYGDGKKAVIPNNKDACEKEIGAKWKQYPSHGVPKPDCRETEWSRDNHLGNTKGGQTPTYKWKIPDHISENCILRIRYNISTNDFNSWDPAVNANRNTLPEPYKPIEPSDGYNKSTGNCDGYYPCPPEDEYVEDSDPYAPENEEAKDQGYSKRSALKTDYDDTTETENYGINLGYKFGLSPEAATKQGYNYKSNPQVDIFGEEGLEVKLHLAIKTNQFGRTFEDRSHRFEIRERPAELEDKTIINLNTRGKRGNIVQTYPATEYDFTPNRLEIAEGDYVHIQWTGANSNPGNNDGQGLAGTDRSNMVLLGNGTGSMEESGHLASSFPMPMDEWGAHSMEMSQWGWSSAMEVGRYKRSNPTEMQGQVSFMGLSDEDLMQLATLQKGHYGGSMHLLDDAYAYFNLGARKVTKAGVYHYMSTRNNNFSNRSQKGTIVVVAYATQEDKVGQNGGNITFKQGSAKLKFPRGSLSNLTTIRVEERKYKEGEEFLKSCKASGLKAGYDYASSYLLISPRNKITYGNTTFEINMKIDPCMLGHVTIHHMNPDSFTGWTKINATITGNIATFHVNHGGLFVARKEYNLLLVVGAGAGVVLVAAALVAVVAVTVVKLRRRPDKNYDMGKPAVDAEYPTPNLNKV